LLFIKKVNHTGFMIRANISRILTRLKKPRLGASRVMSQWKKENNKRTRGSRGETSARLLSVNQMHSPTTVHSSFKMTL